MFFSRDISLVDSSKNMDVLEGDRRPISAPAVMTNTVAAKDPTELAEYYCGNRANPRSPKPEGAVFTMDQQPMNYVATAKALLQSRQRQRDDERAAVDVADPCIEAGLSVAEEQRESERPYNNRDFATPKKQSQNSSTAQPSSITPVETLPISAIASKKAVHLDSLGAAIRRGHHHKSKNERPAAVMLQRQFRRHRAAGQGQRLVAVLALLRTESVAPRMPLLVSKGICSASNYLSECVLEYEYQLEVENLSRCLVEGNRASVGASRWLGPTMIVRKCVLSAEELSSLQEAVQEHINDGEMLSQGGGAAFPEGILVSWAIRALDSFLRQISEETRQQLGSSFVSFLLDSRKENIGVAPSSASSSSGASSAHPWRPANLGDVPSVKEKTGLVLDVLRQGAAAVTNDIGSVNRLAAGVPKDWFVGLVEISKDQDAPLSEVPFVAAAATSTAFQRVAFYDDAQPIWSRGNDPELERERRIEVRRARRRVMGAEYSSSGSDSEEDVMRRIGDALSIAEDNDLVGTAEYFRKRLEHEAALKKHAEAASSPQAHARNPSAAASFDPLLWGLVGTSPEATRKATAIALGKDLVEGEVRSMVLQPRRSRGRSGEASPPSPAVPSICVVCELDSIGVRRCVCGNWIHPECAVDESSMTLLCSRYCS